MAIETATAAVREKTISAVEKGITKATHTTIHAINEGTDSGIYGLLGEVPPFSAFLPSRQGKNVDIDLLLGRMASVRSHEFGGVISYSIPTTSCPPQTTPYFWMP